MTALPTIVVDPVVGAAIANRITEYAGLGGVVSEGDLICPTCGASASLPLEMTCRDHRPTMWHPVGSRYGVVPTAGTYVLATTSQEPTLGHRIETGRSITFSEHLVTKTEGGWRLVDLCNEESCPIEVGKVLGTVRFEPLPVSHTHLDLRLEWNEFVNIHPPSASVHRKPVLEDWIYEDITSSLPFGDWSKLAGHFADFTQFVRDPHLCGRDLEDGPDCNKPTGHRATRDDFWCRYNPRDAPAVLACPFPYTAPDRPCFTTIDPTEAVR